MQTASLIAQEQALYEQQERIRRRRILTALLPVATFGAVCGVGYDALVIWAEKVSDQPYVWFNFTSTIMLAVFYCGATIALIWGFTEIATAIAVGSTSVGILFIVLVRGLDRSIDPTELIEFMLFAVALLLAGALGNLKTIILTTAGLTIATCVLLLVGHPHAGLVAAWRQEQWAVLTQAVLLEWLIAAIMGAQWYAHRLGMKDLGLAVERAKQLEELRDRFITHINHELRTPIMTLNGSIEYLMLASDSLTPEEQAQILERAHRTGQNLKRLLSSILDARRVEVTEVMVPQVLHVRAIIETATTLVAPYDEQMEPRALYLRVSPDLTVLAEQTYLEQIMVNLLSNALKYSPVQAPIEIAAFRCAHSKIARGRPMVEIRVRDYGPGIPPEHMPLLFHRFVRLPRDLASDVPGSGLGLYICRILTEAMGGTINAESAGEPGEGSTFVLHLPVP